MPIFPYAGLALILYVKLGNAQYLCDRNRRHFHGNSDNGRKKGRSVSISLILLKEIIKLFLVMLMGFALIRTGKLSSRDGKALSVLLVYLILPCVIIHSFQIDPSEAVRKGLLFSFCVAVAMHVLFIILTAVFRPVLKLNVVEQMSMIYTNAGILVFPLVTALLGPEYLVYPCAYTAVQLMLIWTHGSYLLCGSGEIHIRTILTNINVLSILAGALLFLFQISLPPIIDQTMNSVGSMIGPVGMLITGMAIADCNLKEIFGNMHAYLPVFMRLIAYPVVLAALLAVFPAASLIDDGKAILMSVFLASITPTAAIVTSMTALYNKDSIYSAELCVLSTILSIITMPVLLFVFDCVV